MDENREERLVLSFESIAKSLEGIHEEARRAGNRYWPKPREQKQAVWSRVENEEDRARKSLGVSDEAPLSIKEWITDIGDPEGEAYIGEREREWRRTHPPEGEKDKKHDASAEIPLFGEKDNPSVEEVESKTRSVEDDTPNNSTAKIKRQGRSKGGS